MLRRGIACFLSPPQCQKYRVFSLHWSNSGERVRTVVTWSVRDETSEGQIRIQSRAKRGRSGKLSSASSRFVVPDAQWKRQSMRSHESARPAELVDAASDVAELRYQDLPDSAIQELWPEAHAGG